MRKEKRVGQLRTVLEMIKIEHTLFALPFAFLGMILAAEGWPSWATVGWIVMAMVGARSAAMGFNRLVDRHFDAENPRTAQRALPAQQIAPRFVGLFVLSSSAVFLLAAWRLNRLTLILAPIALVVLLGYSYTKRFTSWSHLILGLALGGAPLGGWIAVRGDVAATPLLLTAIVLCWVAGFDVLYALQDLEFDRDRGLHSIPARLGERPALWVSGLLHLAMLGLLVALPRTYPPGLGWAYWLGVAGCAALLGYQHTIVRPGDLSRLDAAFFQANGLLAVWLFAMTAVDQLLLA
ncbi:MAG: putative 4-hydroxybenzoate polyprenyltransferase [Acidobacteria bacterium]|nr:putative 4-hydroxybenzoate polyprenyltransferase [Acidobacteriota bacterium]